MRLPTVQFLTEPALERAPKGQYTLLSPLMARVAGIPVTVPPGFTTDGASIPTPFWPLISNPFAPSSLRAAILHDFQCRTRSLSSPLVHRIFYAALLADGCARLRAWLMYQAVRLFGPRWS